MIILSHLIARGRLICLYLRYSTPIGTQSLVLRYLSGVYNISAKITG